MPVYFKCKSCRSEHRSPAGFPDKISFDTAPMQVTELRCYGTGRTAAYRRSDMYWRDELGE
jgi:hypothetical protein